LLSGAAKKTRRISPGNILQKTSDFIPKIEFLRYSPKYTKKPGLYDALRLVTKTSQKNRVSEIWARPGLILLRLTESIQDTSPRIHPWRNKKPVSDETCPPNFSVGSMLQFFNLKSKI
jgi:hypothetical protein